MKSHKKQSSLFGDCFFTENFYIPIYFFSAYWLIRVLASYFWIKSKRLSYKRNSINATRPFILVIPVLEEQEIVLSTIDYFLNLIKPFPGSRLVIVTTAKENKIYEEKRESVKKLLCYGKRKEIITAIKFNFNKNLDDTSGIG